MSPRSVWAIATKERLDMLRQRWFWLYSGTFAVLSLALAATALTGSGYTGLAGFGRTTASMLNLVMITVPLVGLISGALSLAGERDQGTLAYLLAQPLSRAEVFTGKLLGQVLGLGGTLVLGFGVSGFLVGARGGPQEARTFLVLLGLALVLLVIHLALGFLIAVFSSRAQSALAVALLAWIGLTLVGDLGLLGLAAMLKLKPASLLLVSLANPIQVFRLAALLALRSSLEMLGPVGLFVTRTWPSAALPMLVGVLASWALVPSLLAGAAFGRRNLT